MVTCGNSPACDRTDLIYQCTDKNSGFEIQYILCVTEILNRNSKHFENAKRKAHLC